MTKKIKYIFPKNKLPRRITKKGYLLLFGIILTTLLLTISFSHALTASSSNDGTDLYPAPPAKVAMPETQFNLDIVYAYVGAAPQSALSYINENNNQTMHLVSQYPSTVRLNITRVPGVQIASCDAEIEVYAIDITTNTGTSEHHAFFVGTNYNASFSNSIESKLESYVNDLVDHNIYSEITGTFIFNSTANTSLLSHTIGSIGAYSTGSGNWTGLWSAGRPNVVSVNIHRIGYLTMMTNSSVTIYKDSGNNETANAQLNNYENGFLANKIVPLEKLPQSDLFHPDPLS